jgi:DeoR/GlpR family transcriptional regulator of sugar metabolism
MLREERIWRIIQDLRNDGKVLVEDLAKEFDVSPATIRLDLNEMEQRGIAKKVYGGAISKNSGSPDILLNEQHFSERLEANFKEKKLIGKLAVSLINDGETIMIDGGSTTYQLCKNLYIKNNLNVITCAFFNLWPELVAKSNMQLFLIGGFLRKESLSLVGEVREGMIDHFRANKYFMGIDGISLEHGLTTLNYQEASLKKRLLESSQELIIVTDHTKFGKVCPIPVSSLERVSKIVTDSGISQSFRKSLENKGIELIIAEIPEE